MKFPIVLAGGLALPAVLHAVELVYEPFDYTAAENLTSLAGGSGWAGGWTQDGESSVVAAGGLAFTDNIGNVLTVAGLAADTTGGATTRNFRVVADGPLTDVWISFLWNLPGSNSKFEGLNFHRGTQSVFSVSNPSTTTGPAIHLANTLSGGASVNTLKGGFGFTHLVVLRLTKDGGPNGSDRVEAFIDPLLSGVPSVPDATVNGSNFDFDSIRIAGQDGSPLAIDEFRIGNSFAEVTPHTPGLEGDSDGDGLSDAQEAVLGLDPNSSDAALIAAIQAHPEWFGLYSAEGILQLGNGGTIVQKSGNDPVGFTFEVQHSENLLAWPVLETFNRSLVLPDGKNFLRLTLENP